MNIKDCIYSDAGRVIRLSQGYCAFVPAPQPPMLSYDAELVPLLSRADAALSELSGFGRNLPQPAFADSAMDAP